MTTEKPTSENSSRLLDFSRYFDLSVALTREQRERVYHLRYRVYCEEFGYEPPEVFSNQQEMDTYEESSIHCLVSHRETGKAAGCVRLVLANENSLMPMEGHAGDSLDQAFMSQFSGRRNTLCEISRLAVDSDFRRRRGERETRFGASDAFNFSKREQRTFPLIALFLFMASGAVADVLNRKNCCAIMEPSLFLLLRRAGTVFRRIGDDFEFRGTRAPYYANIDDLVAHAPVELRQMYGAVYQQIAGALEPVPQRTPEPRAAIDRNKDFGRSDFGWSWLRPAFG